MRINPGRFLFKLWLPAAAQLALGPQSCAFGVTPVLSSGAQALEFRCLEAEEECLRFCEGASFCIRPESPCPGCAGTGNLRLKRVLDSVGLGLRARSPERSSRVFFDLLRSSGWISLHPRTLYNYSSAWNGSAIRAAFRRACEGVSGGGDGMVLLSVDGPSFRVPSVLGVLCQDAGSVAARWWSPDDRAEDTKETPGHE